MSNVDPLHLDYIKRSIKVDKAKGDVTLHNKEKKKGVKYEGGRDRIRAEDSRPSPTESRPAHSSLEEAKAAKDYKK
jgi:hypothetical protein